MLFSRYLCSVLTVIAVGIAAGPAPAQNLPETMAAPPSADAAIERERADRRAPVPVLADRPPAPPVPETEAKVAAVETGTPEILREVVFEGATLPNAVLKSAVSGFVGQELGQTQVKAIADAVSKAYGRSDIAYFAVVVPPQVPKEGRLVVRVVEGTLTEHRIIDPTPSTPIRLIGSYVDNMKGGPLRKSRLDRYLSLIRDIPGQKVSAKIVPLNQQGDLVLELTITRKQVELEVSLDNAGVANVINGPVVQASAKLNGTLREGDTTKFTANVPFAPDRYQYYSVTHETPIGANGLSLALAGAHLQTRTRSGIEGEATLGSITAQYKVLRSGNSNITLSASFDALSSSNNFLDTTFGDFETRVVRLGAVASDGDNKQAFAISSILSQGLDGLGARPVMGFSETGFTKINLTSAFAQSIKDDLVLRVSARGQYSPDLLPVTESFALGGRGKGLAFLPGSLIADQGAGGSIELSQPIKIKSLVLPKVTLFTFADGSLGRVLARPLLGLDEDSVGLASAGGGIRFSLLSKLSATVEFAVQVASPDTLVERPPVVLFNIVSSL